MGQISGRRSATKETEDFLKIAEILGMSFVEVQDLVYSLRKTSVDESYIGMMSEEYCSETKMIENKRSATHEPIRA